MATLEIATCLEEVNGYTHSAAKDIHHDVRRRVLPHNTQATSLHNISSTAMRGKSGIPVNAPIKMSSVFVVGSWSQ